MTVIRTYYAVGLHLRAHRFVIGVIAPLLYLGTTHAIITDVLAIPLTGALVTSGAPATMLGLVS